MEDEHVCNCNDFSCACQNLVEHSGEICPDCRIGEHLLVDDDEYDVNDDLSGDHNFLVD